MTGRLPTEAVDRIRALLRDRDYAGAAAYADRALASFGIEPPTPDAPPPRELPSPPRPPRRVQVDRRDGTVGERMSRMIRGEADR